MVVSLNYCSQNGGNVFRDPYYNGNPNIGPRIIGNLDQYPCTAQILGPFGRSAVKELVHNFGSIQRTSGAGYMGVSQNLRVPFWGSP